MDNQEKQDKRLLGVNEHQDLSIFVKENARILGMQSHRSFYYASNERLK